MNLKYPNCNNSQIIQEVENKYSITYNIHRCINRCIRCRMDIDIIQFCIQKNGRLIDIILTNEISIIMYAITIHLNYAYKSDYSYIITRLLNKLPKQLLTTELELFLKLI